MDIQIKDCIHKDDGEALRKALTREPRSRERYESAVDSPLIVVAAEEGKSSCLRSLIGMGESPDAAGRLRATPLMRAAVNDQVECVRILLEAGAHAGARDINGNTPLMWAVAGRSVGCVQALIDAGADIDAINIHGASAIGHAGAIEAFDCVKILGAGRLGAGRAVLELEEPWKKSFKLCP